jgi:hypothetical protein
MRAAAAAAAASALIFTGSAYAADPADGWVAHPGATVGDDGVVALDSTGTTAGTSFENATLDLAVTAGDTISFEYKGVCSGGAPRAFIQGGAYNTWDDDPMGASCGTPIGTDGWYVVTTVVTSDITTTTAGVTGIVNDDTSSPRVIEVRNLTIDGVAVPLASNEHTEETKPKKANHGQCVRAAERTGEARSKAAHECGKEAKSAKAAKATKAKKATKVKKAKVSTK